jgi:hypothetical protein
MLTVDMLSEPVIVPDTYVSGLADIEPLEDGNMRFTFYARQRSAYGGPAFLVVSRLVLPTCAVHAALRLTVSVLGYEFPLKARHGIVH